MYRVMAKQCQRAQPRERDFSFFLVRKNLGWMDDTPDQGKEKHLDLKNTYRGTYIYLTPTRWVGTRSYNLSDLRPCLTPFDQFFGVTWKRC